MESSYGKTCTSCFRAKYKCIYRTDGAGCERCHRLKRDCQPSQSVRKRNAKQPRSKRVELEEKVERLEGILKSQGKVIRPDHTQTQLPPASYPLAQHFKSSRSNNAFPLPPELGRGENAVSTDPITPAPTAPHSNISICASPLVDDVSLYYIPDAIAEEQLHTFRSIFLTAFPFIHMPAARSSARLRLEKPFLWLVIMALTTKSTAQQLAMAATVRQIVSQKVATGQEKSLDVLLGMVCYLGWFQYFKKDGAYLTIWAQITVALVYELGIHKMPRDDRGAGQFGLNLLGFAASNEGQQVRTLEERRAAIAVFIITSTFWICYRKMEPQPWTSYLDDCVRVLDQEQGSEMDALLILTAKCYQIMNQITHSRTEYPVEGDSAAKVPPSYLVKALLSQLDSLQTSLAPQLQSNKAAHLYLYATRIIILEASMARPKPPSQHVTQTAHMTHDHLNRTVPAAHTTHQPTADITRLATLSSLLTHIKNWLKTYLSTPTLSWLGFPFSIVGQQSHSIILLFMLSTLQESCWDTQDVRRRVNLVDVLDQFVRGFEELGGVYGDSGDSMLGKGMRMMRWIRGMVEVEFVSRRGLGGGGREGCSGSVGSSERVGNTAGINSSGSGTGGAERVDGRQDTDGVAGGNSELGMTEDVAMWLADDVWFGDMFASWRDIDG